MYPVKERVCVGLILHGAMAKCLVPAWYYNNVGWSLHGAIAMWAGLGCMVP